MDRRHRTSHVSRFENAIAPHSFFHLRDMLVDQFIADAMTMADTDCAISIVTRPDVTSRAKPSAVEAFALNMEDAHVLVKLAVGLVNRRSRRMRLERREKVAAGGGKKTTRRRPAKSRS